VYRGDELESVEVRRFKRYRLLKHVPCLGEQLALVIVFREEDSIVVPGLFRVVLEKKTPQVCLSRDDSARGDENGRCKARIKRE
jgi:hypothetical protein